MLSMRDGVAGGDGSRCTSILSKWTCAARRTADGVFFFIWHLISACRQPTKYNFCYGAKNIGVYYQPCCEAICISVRTRCASTSSFVHHSSINWVYAPANSSGGHCSVPSASRAASISSFACRKASTSALLASSPAEVRASARVARSATAAA